MSRKNLPFVLVILILVMLILTQSQLGNVTSTVQGRTQSIDRTSLPVITPEITPPPSPTLPAFLQIPINALRSIEVEFWNPWTGHTSQAIAEQVDEFNAKNEWGIRVNLRNFDSEQDLNDAIVSGFTTNQLPNIIAAPNEQLLTWQRDGQVLVDLEPYVTSAQYGLSVTDQADFFPIFWDQDRVNGFRLGIPAERIVDVIYYNKTWAESLGFPYSPTTPDEFHDQACAAAQLNNADAVPENDGTGGWIIDTKWQTVMSWLSSFGMDTYPIKPEDAYHFFTPSAETAFQFLRKLSDDGCAWSPRDPRPYEYFSKRYALFYSADIRSIYAQSLTLERLKSTDQWTVLAYPDTDGNPTTISYGPSYAIMLSSMENQLASWLFIRWMSSTSNQVKMVIAEGSLPLSYSAVAELGGYGEAYPMWEGALGWISSTHIPPKLASWTFARVVLEDSAWMALSANVTINNVPTILQQLDNTILELSTK